MPASAGTLTITLDQTADVDLKMCPDESGLAEGAITIDADMMATGTVASSGSDGDMAHADSNGIGAKVPYGENGDPVTSGIEGHGSTSGTASTIDARAVHQIDGAGVTGTLAVTPTTGTFDPLAADAPATIRVIPDEGAAKVYAKVEFRSLRGIATTDIEVDARGFHVALSGIVIEGPADHASIPVTPSA